MNSPCPAKLRDRDIRDAILHRVVPRLNRPEPCRVIEELGILAGRIRIDIAVANGKLHGFEIKSEADTLERLQDQMTAYSRVFDRITLVCGANHAPHCLERIPKWWGISIARRDAKRGVALETLRRPSDNRNIDPPALLSLLWKEELIALIEERCGDRKLAHLNKKRLAIIAAETFHISELRDRVRQTLKTREHWRSDQPPE